MGRSKSEARCKKHPNHKQSSGVCSSCLRERLSQLSSSKNIITTSSSSSSTCSSSSSSSSPSYSSGSCSSSSSCASPSHYLSLGTNGWISFGIFRRSRSVAFGRRFRVRDAAVDGERMRKGGFWSKLLRTSSKERKKDFMHSNTINETACNGIYTL